MVVVMVMMVVAGGSSPRLHVAEGVGGRGGGRRGGKGRKETHDLFLFVSFLVTRAEMLPQMDKQRKGWS